MFCLMYFEALLLGTYIFYTMFPVRIDIIIKSVPLYPISVLKSCSLVWIYCVWCYNSHTNFLMISILRNKTVFKSYCSILYSHQPCTKVTEELQIPSTTFYGRLCVSLLFNFSFLFFLFNHSNGFKTFLMSSYLSVVLICISLMISEVDHFFMYLLPFVSIQTFCAKNAKWHNFLKQFDNF